MYSRVQNKRGGGENYRGGGLEMVRSNNNRGVGIIGGGGVLVGIENSLFLSENVSLIYLCEQQCY